MPSTNAEVVARPYTTKLVEEAIELVESTLKTSVPEPFWTRKAVVDEIFMSSPPEAVNPDKKTLDELYILRRLAVWAATAVMSTPALVEVVSTTNLELPDPS